MTYYIPKFTFVSIMSIKGSENLKIKNLKNGKNGIRPASAS